MDQSDQTIPSNASTPNFSSQSKLVQKVLLILSGLGIFLLGILVGLGINLYRYTQIDPYVEPYSNTQVPDSTQNWPVFTSAVLGISFKYPPTWYPDNSVEAAPLFYTDTTLIGTPNYKMSVVSADSRYQDSYMEQPVGTKKEIGDKIFEERIANIQIGNRKGMKSKVEVMSGSSTDAIPGLRFKVWDDSRIISFELSSPTNEEAQYFDQIVNTIKFNMEMTDWKTYSNSEVGFNIKHPNFSINDSSWTKVGENNKGMWNLVMSKNPLTYVQVSVTPNPKTVSGETISTIQDSVQGVESVIYSQFESYPLAQFSYQTTTSNKDPITEKVTHILKDGSLWRIVGSYSTGDSASSILVDQIIFTFKFEE